MFLHVTPAGKDCLVSFTELLVKNVGGLLKDVNGKRQLDSSALEQLVASVEVCGHSSFHCLSVHKSFFFILTKFTQISK